MFRFAFLSLVSCSIFAACSSDDSAPLKDWFESRDIEVSYKAEYAEASLSFRSAALGFDSSAFMAASLAALGNANGLEHSLYFGLIAKDSLEPEWRLKADSLFYDVFHGGEFSLEADSAMLCWRRDSIIEHDSSWIKLEKPWEDSAMVSLSLDSAGDAILLALPEGLRGSQGRDSVLLVGARLVSDGEVLRINPSQSSVQGLIRAAQRTRILERCEACIYSGINDSLVVSFDVDGLIDTNKTIVFAQIVFPLLDGNADSELGFPMPVYALGEEYRVDTVYVNEKGGHPNLLFFGGNDSLRLQVTKGLRRYASSLNRPDTLSFALWLGNPMLSAESKEFSSSAFATRPAYARYDFAYLEKAKLRIWHADFGDKK